MGNTRDFIYLLYRNSEMFVYYKLYREPVSPTISITQCGDQGKTAVPGIEVVQEKTRSVRLTFYFILLERMSSFSAGQSTALITTSTCSS